MRKQKLVMIPGPTPVARSIQNQMARDTAAFKDPEFVEDFKEVLKDLREMWHAHKTFVIAGTGTLAMEIAVCNSVKKGDNILIISNGYFGDRFIEICERKGINADVLQSTWGETVPLEQIQSQLKKKSYQAVTVSHVDTSTGVVAPVNQIGNIIKNYPEMIYIVDGVCASAAEKEYLDEMNIDILFTGSQKAFGITPGLAIIWASEKALQRRDSLGMIPEYYADFNKWLPVMDDPMKYFGTPPVNFVWALQEAIRIIKEEGLEERNERHQKVALAMAEALEEMGFEILADKSCRATTLSNVIYPEGTDDALFRKTLAEEGVVVAGGLGAWAGKLFRLGHMGNINNHVLSSVIGAIERTSCKLGMDIKTGIGHEVLARHFSK